MKKYRYKLEDLDCAACGLKIQDGLSKNENCKNVVVNYSTLSLTFESDKENIKDEVIETIAKLEPEVNVIDLDNYKEKISEKYTKNQIAIFRLVIGLVFFGISYFTRENQILSLIFIICAYISLLFRTSINALKLLKNKVIDENFLVTISCIGALIIGKNYEGFMVIFLYEIGKILEDKAVNNTRKSITSLMDIRPEYANLKVENGTEIVEPDEINIGDIIEIRQGEKVPIDGKVVSGEAYLNTSSLTGESKLQKVASGDTILSGSINEKGLIEAEVTKKYEDSTVSKILDLVENATDKKAKTETFVNKASRVYTPFVVSLSILLAIFLPIIYKSFGNTLSYKESIYRALIFLVVSCPCAIVISVPLAYFTGIGKASKKGILIKGSNFLDNIKDIKTIVFDKTGTITKGVFGVTKIVCTGDVNEEEILKIAAHGENFSNHPIAKAIVKAYGKNIDKSRVKEFEEISGNGLKYRFDDNEIKLGKNEFIGIPEVKENGTVICVSINEKYVGYILLSDIIKEEAKDAVLNLNNGGIETAMFTGDSGEIAFQVGKEIGFNTIKAEMLPQDKYAELEKIIATKKEGKVAFVGDGINDSPVLARADVGISMGGIGSNSAIEASDVVIMTDDLRKIDDMIRISKYTNKIIVQNLVFALGVKILVLVLSAIGISNMWQAVFADTGVTLITILNILRILKSDT